MEQVSDRDSVEAVFAARSLEECARRDLRTVLCTAALATVLHTAISSYFHFRWMHASSALLLAALFLGLAGRTSRLTLLQIRLGSSLTSFVLSAITAAYALKIGPSSSSFQSLLLLPLGLALLFPRDFTAVVVGSTVVALGGLGVLSRFELSPGAAPSWVAIFSAVFTFALVRTFAWRGVQREEMGKLEQAAVGERDRIRHARAIFENAGEAMLVLDERLRCIDANPSALRLFDSSRSQLIGRSLHRFCAELDDEEIHARLAKAKQTVEGERQQGELELQIHPGELLTVEYTLLSGILPSRHLAILRDVTAARRMQAGLAMMDRLASVGMLAAGVGHELNNPLAYVMGNVEYVRGLLRASDGRVRADPLTPHLRARALQALDEASEGAERMRLVVRDLRTFSRADDTQAGPVDIHEVLRSCSSMVRTQLRHRGRLVMPLDGSLYVHGNEARLSQVFLNLLVNAAQSLSESAATKNEVRVGVSTLPGPEGRIEIRIEDTGCGIAPEVLPRIFEPFFTTKPSGIGTGLGLFICQGIVQSYGGELWAESELGKGSRFSVRLQPANLQPAASRSTGAEPLSAPDSLHLWVIDDDAAVASCIERMLGSEMQVSVCTSPVLAFQRLLAGELPDLILCDVLMPELAGPELYRRLELELPHVARRIVFMTGAPCGDGARALLDSGQVAWIEKPFTPEALRAFIREQTPRTDSAAA